MEYESDGFKIFKDEITMPVFHQELEFMWWTLRDLLEGSGNLRGKSPVPPHEVEKVLELMKMMAVQDKDTRKEFNMKIKINYFMGLWHGLDMSRKCSIYKDDKDKSDYLRGLTLKVAELLDIYHAQKGKTGFAETMKPSKTAPTFELAQETSK